MTNLTKNILKEMVLEIYNNILFEKKTSQIKAKVTRVRTLTTNPAWKTPRQMIFIDKGTNDGVEKNDKVSTKTKGRSGAVRWVLKKRSRVQMRVPTGQELFKEGDIVKVAVKVKDNLYDEPKTKLTKSEKEKKHDDLWHRRDSICSIYKKTKKQKEECDRLKREFKKSEEDIKSSGSGSDHSKSDETSELMQKEARKKIQIGVGFLKKAERITNLRDLGEVVGGVAAAKDALIEAERAFRKALGLLHFIQDQTEDPTYKDNARGGIKATRKKLKQVKALNQILRDEEKAYVDFKSDKVTIDDQNAFRDSINKKKANYKKTYSKGKSGSRRGVRVRTRRPRFVRGYGKRKQEYAKRAVFKQFYDKLKQAGIIGKGKKVLGRPFKKDYFWGPQHEEALRLFKLKKPEVKPEVKPTAQTPVGGPTTKEPPTNVLSFDGGLHYGTEDDPHPELGQILTQTDLVRMARNMNPTGATIAQGVTGKWRHGKWIPDNPAVKKAVADYKASLSKK